MLIVLFLFLLYLSSSLRGLFRTANHTFHVNLKEQAIQDRAQLLRYSVQNTASLYNTDESSSRDVLNASLGEKQQHNHQREQEHGQEQPLYSGSNSHGSNHKQQTLSVSEIRKRAAGSSSATSSQQRLVSTASDITSSLRNTTQLMTTQLQQSADMLNVLGEF